MSKATARAKCSQPGCGEWAHWEYDTRKDMREASARRYAWKCTRHSRPEEVLSSDRLEITTTLIATKSGSGVYWYDGNRLGSGFSGGPGFKAWAEDFPEGTRLTVTAHIACP